MQVNREGMLKELIKLAGKERVIDVIIGVYRDKITKIVVICEEILNPIYVWFSSRAKTNK